MLTQEEIADIILDEVRKVTEELGEEAALIFLSGVKFGSDLAAKTFLNASEQELVDLSDYYMNITKGEIN